MDPKSAILLNCLRFNSLLLDKDLAKESIPVDQVDSRLVKLDELIGQLPKGGELRKEWEAKARRYRVQLAQKLPLLPELSNWMAELALNSGSPGSSSSSRSESAAAPVEPVEPELDANTFSSGTSAAAIRSYIEESFTETQSVPPSSTDLDQHIYCLVNLTIVVARAIALLEIPIMAKHYDQLQKELFLSASAKLAADDLVALTSNADHHRPDGHLRESLSSLLLFLKERIKQKMHEYRTRPTKMRNKIRRDFFTLYPDLTLQQRWEKYRETVKCSFCGELWHEYDTCSIKKFFAICFKCYQLGHEMHRCQNAPLFKYI